MSPPPITVGLGDQFAARDLQSRRVGEVERNAALVAIKTEESRRSRRRFRRARSDACRPLRHRAFDLDDLSAEIGERLRTGRPATTRVKSTTSRPSRAVGSPLRVVSAPAIAWSGSHVQAFLCPGRRMVPFFIAARSDSRLSTGSLQLTPNPDFAGPDFKLTWLLPGTDDIPRHGHAAPAASSTGPERTAKAHRCRAHRPAGRRSDLRDASLGIRRDSRAKDRRRPTPGLESSGETRRSARGYPARRGVSVSGGPCLPVIISPEPPNSGRKVPQLR